MRENRTVPLLDDLAHIGHTDILVAIVVPGHLNARISKRDSSVFSHFFFCF